MVPLQSARSFWLDHLAAIDSPESECQPAPMRKGSYIGVGMALGVAFGVSLGSALGTAFHHAANGAAIGVTLGSAFGLLVGAVYESKRRNG
jgi:hypothetical protein